MIRKLLKTNAFAKNILTLMTGTSIAQAIPIAISPILTRLYTPDDFGVLALFMAISSICAVIATGRYELAIMLPEEETDAANILALSIGISLLLSSLIFVALLFLNHPITQLLGNPAIGNWLYFIPLTVLVAGLYQSMNYWSTRREHFKRLAYVRVTQGAGTGLSQLGLGYVTRMSGGLILGYIAGQVLAVAVFARQVWLTDKLSLKSISFRKVLGNAKTYKKFPQFSTLGALLDNAALQMPILVLTKFFSTHVTGLFSFTFRVLNLPMALISTALSEVLFQKVVNVYQHSPEKLFIFILKIFFGLLVITIPFLLVSSFFGKQIFIFLFGKNWGEAGEFAAFLSIAVAIRFSVSPLSCVLAMEHNLKAGFYWQLLYIITITTTLLVAGKMHVSIKGFIVIFTIHEVILYLVYLIFILIGARHRINN